jgi:hypothetical protein
LRPGWPYASVTFSDTPDGPVSRVAAPVWLRRWFQLVSLGLIAACLVIAFGSEHTTSDWLFIPLFLAFGALILGLNWVLYLRPFAEAGPKGLRGRGLGTEQLVPWNEISEVVLAHRFGLGFFTRTELLIVRAHAQDREPRPFCVLHFLRGIWLGQRCSRSASRPFLDICSRYGPSTRSAWSNTAD